MDVLILIALVVLNGLFAMSEIALVAARRSRLTRMAEEGDRSAAAALSLQESPTAFLSTIQIGITSIGVLNGMVGEAVLAEPLAHRLQVLGLAGETASIAATALVAVGITYVSIVLGELVPKRLGQFDPEGTARRVARSIRLLSRLAYPFVRLLAVSTESILFLAGQKLPPAPAATEEEIHALLEEGAEAGAIEPGERDMVRNVLRLDRRPVGSLMIPRVDIDYLDLLSPTEDNLRHIRQSRHSRFPVCRGGLGEVVGIVTAKQILDPVLEGGALDIAPLVQAGLFVPETMTGLALLEHFRATGGQMALIVDEYGEVQGLVTLQDVLGAVAGEMAPGDGTEARAQALPDGSWRFDGLIAIPDFQDRLGLRSVPEEERGRYHTLGGYLMWRLGRLPQPGDSVPCGPWTLEVVGLDGKRVGKVLARPV